MRGKLPLPIPGERVGVRGLDFFLILIGFLLASGFPAEASQPPTQTILVDDFEKASPFNQLGGLFGSAAKGGETHFDFGFEGIPHFATNSFLKLNYNFKQKPAYGFLWMKLGRARGSSRETEYLDLSRADFLSFRYRADDSVDFKIELHEDRNGDGIYVVGEDKSSLAYLRRDAASFEMEGGWKKALIPLGRFGSGKIKDWSKILELVLVFEEGKSKNSGEVWIDDLVFSNASDLTQPESMALEIQAQDDPRWHPAASFFFTPEPRAFLSWHSNTFDPPKTFSMRWRIRDFYGRSYLVAGPFENQSGPSLSDEEFLNLIEEKAFLYFLENQDPDTGLFLDTAWGGDASIAVTGFGLNALVIGAERGWISKSEARQRAERTLDTFLEKAEGKDGFYYHFLNPKTGQRAGQSEVSTVDTALLLGGVITAGHYFGGSVEKKAEEIYRRVQWPTFLKDSLFHQNWKPESGYSDYFWHDYSDEVLLIALLAVGSPTHPVPSEVYRSFEKQKASKDEGGFVMSWHGGLFSYQYAHSWFDFRRFVDPEGIRWWENSKQATIASRRFSLEESKNYQTYGPDSWGITSMWVPHQYVMHYGSLPNAQEAAFHDGTVSPSGPAGSIIFTPYLSLRALKYFYQNHPELWGPYGFKDSFNEDEGWTSSMYYGLSQGLILSAIENFRSGLLWENFMKDRNVKNSLRKVGFKKIDLKREKQKQPKEKLKKDLYELQSLQAHDLERGRRYLKEKNKIIQNIRRRLQSSKKKDRQGELLIQLQMADIDMNEKWARKILKDLARETLRPDLGRGFSEVQKTIDRLGQSGLSQYVTEFEAESLHLSDPSQKRLFKNFLARRTASLLARDEIEKAQSIYVFIRNDQRYEKFEERILKRAFEKKVHQPSLAYLDQALSQARKPVREGWLRLNRGILLERMGRTAPAIEQFEGILRTSGEENQTAQAGQFLARLYHRLPGPEAKTKINFLMAENPEPLIQAAGHFFLGVKLQQENFLDKAALEFEKIQIHFPGTNYSQWADQELKRMKVNYTT